MPKNSNLPWVTVWTSNSSLVLESFKTSLKMSLKISLTNQTIAEIHGQIDYAPFKVKSVKTAFLPRQTHLAVALVSCVFNSIFLSCDFGGFFKAWSLSGPALFADERFNRKSYY